MTEKLASQPDHDVLEIGTGSGYQAAILARLCRHVYTIERHGELLLAANGVSRGSASAISPPSSATAPRAGPSRASSTASSSPPPPWASPKPSIAQLEPDGRMILPMGGACGRQRLVLVTMTPGGTERQELIAGPLRPAGHRKIKSNRRTVRIAPKMAVP